MKTVLFILLVVVGLFCPLLTTAQTSTITWTNVHQTMDGFGAQTWNYANSLNSAQADLFFSPTAGIGLEYVRTANTSGGTIPDLVTLQAAVARGAYVELGFQSPPTSLKNSGSFTDGTAGPSGECLIGNPVSSATWTAWANYMVTTIQNYQSNGIPISVIDVQNEPGITSSTLGACVLTASGFNTFIGTYLGPALSTAGLSPRVMMPSYESWFSSDRATTCLNNSTCKNYVSIVAGHGYNYPFNFTSFNTQGKTLWMSETSDSSAFDSSMTNALTMAQNEHLALTTANASTYQWWELAYSSGSGNYGLTDSSFSTTKRFWVYGNWSKFVRQGWVRIDATACASGVLCTAFKNSSTGAFALVAVNTNGTSTNQTFALSGFNGGTVTPYLTNASNNLIAQGTVSAGTSFTYSLPASSVTTFTGTAVLSGCSGSGLVFTCGAGATNTDVQGAINSASDGAVITQQNGSATWTGTVNLPTTKGITYICQTVGGCSVTTTSMGFQTSGMPSGTLSSEIRISGFVWNSSVRLVWFCSGGGCHNGTVSNFRVDHMIFNGTGSQFLLVGDNSSTNIFVFGVADHNTVNTTGSGVVFEFISTLNSSSTPTPTALGQSSNFFIEDTAINVSNPTNSGVGCTDGWGSAFSVVVRHSTSVNCRWLTHGTGDGGGPRNFEVYNSSTQWTSNNGGLGSGATGIQNCYRAYHNQGAGTGMVFNNSCIPYGTVSGDAIVVMNYRSTCPNSGGEGNSQACCDGTQSGVTYSGTTYISVTDGNRTGEHGYPCWHQMSRDDSLVLHTVGMWNNTTTGGALLGGGFDDLPGGSPDNSLYQMVNGRDYVKGGTQQISSSSPFNGSGGIGWGTHANRPSTCTVTTDPGDVGGTSYFATDDGPQGTLYACVGGSTPWTAVYTPYTYPHPLVSGAANLGVSPTTEACGGVLVGNSFDCGFVTLQNTGTVTANSLTESLSDLTNYQIYSQTCSATLNAGASCTFGIRFIPTVTGSLPATYSITSDTSSTSLAITGTGLTTSLVLSPSSLSFTTNQFTTSASQTVTLTNSTGSTVTVSGITVSSHFSNSGGSCIGTSFSLGAGSTCTVLVTFSPNTTGPFSGTLSVNDSTPGSPHVVTLSGTGTAPVATWTPSSYNFGNVLISIPTNSTALVLSNTGNGPLNVSLSTTGTDAAKFVILSTTCSSTLSAGSNCQAFVTFTPTAASSYSANLTETDSVQGITQNLALTGTGITGTTTAPCPWCLL